MVAPTMTCGMVIYVPSFGFDLHGETGGTDEHTCLEAVGHEAVHRCDCGTRWVDDEEVS